MILLEVAINLFTTTWFRIRSVTSARPACRKIAVLSLIRSQRQLACEGLYDIWTVKPRGVVPLLPLCSQIDVGATVNALLGDTFSCENNTHGSRFHDRDPQFASRILGAMTQSCYIGTCDIRSRVIRGLYCSMITFLFNNQTQLQTHRVRHIPLPDSPGKVKLPVGLT